MEGLVGTIRQLTGKEIHEREIQMKERINQNADRYREEAVKWFGGLGILFTPARFWTTFFEKKQFEKRQNEPHNGNR